MFSRPVLAVFVMKMSWFSKKRKKKKLLGKISFTAQFRWANKEDEEEKQDRGNIYIYC